MPRRTSLLLLLTSAIGAVLLVTLAVLQYRWLGQLSEADAVRMRRHLYGAATQLARDLETEVSRAHTQIQLGRFFYQAQVEGELADRYANWAANNPHRGIVRAVYLTSSGPGRHALRRLNAETGRFEDVLWPDSLAPFRERLIERERPGELPGPPRQQGVGASPLILISPHFDMRPPRFGDRGGPGGGPPGRPPALHWSIVELDEVYICHTLLPALVRRHLSRDGVLDYRVQVADGRSKAPLYDSEPAARGDIIAHPDAEVPLLPVRMGRFFRREEGGFNRPPGPPAPAFAPAEGSWQLLMVHHAGSLEAVVGAVRKRNLAVGFGVLALLAVAIAVMLFALRRAQMLAQLQLEFVAGVSHELRTPLSVIRSAGENLADGVTKGPESVRRYGALVRDEGRRLSEMVEQILAFARTSSAFERQPVEVSDLVERASAACAHELNDNGCELVRDLDPDLPPIDADRTALVHALRNLVSNAATHGGRGEPIHVRARNLGDAVEIEVSDGGPGIEPAEISRIFDPFYRGRRARESQTRGLGLGLSLVKRIIEAHGGSIAAANNPGKGACFMVRLPVAKASVA